MFFKPLVIVSAALLFFGTHVNAHVAISPALGVKGKPACSDVRRPLAAKPCGDANLAAIGSSQAANAASDGSVTMTITNFNVCYSLNSAIAP